MNAVPSYAGGLGVLAADTLLSGADLGWPLVGVSLLYHQNDNLEYGFHAERYFKKLGESVEVEIEGRPVKVVIWQRDIVGQGGHVVPVFFLSTFDPANARWDRDLTKHLYAADRYTRLGQEAILGLGGVRALEKLGYDISHYHLNEGHAALAVLELLKKFNGNPSQVRPLVNFTTHTPIAAGHDYFDYELVRRVLKDLVPPNIQALAGETSFGMTQLALSLSGQVNSVSERHQATCRAMFPNNAVLNVTNGIYPRRWVGEAMKKLFDKNLPGWANQPELLKEAPEKLPDLELRPAKQAQKNELLDWVNSHRNFFVWPDVSSADFLDKDALTIGFARRFVPYKRPELIFQHLHELKRFGEQQKFQIIFANRCHPDDQFCNGVRNDLAHFAKTLRSTIKIVIIPDFDLEISKLLVTGVDIWLNTPIAPLEASGTSGMKAALNGGLNLSILDGWWPEAVAREPLSGWGIGGRTDFANDAARDASDAEELMGALKSALACYYDYPTDWAKRMKHAVALGAYFNTHRVVKDYATGIWQTG